MPPVSPRYMIFPLLAVLIWSVNMVVTKMAASVISPAAISFYRWVVAVLVLAPFTLPGVLRQWALIRPNLWRLAVLGALGMGVYQGLLYVAAATTTATNMGIITSMVPLLTIAVGTLILHERPTRMAVLGALVALLGLGILLGEGDPRRLLSVGGTVGDVLMAVAALSYALYGVLLRKWSLPMGVWQSLFMQAVFVVLFQIPFFVLSAPSPLTAQNLPMVLYAAIFPSLFAPYFWMQGVNHLGPNRASIFLNLMPVGTVVIAALTLGEHPHAYHIVGGLLALAGVSLAQTRARRAARG
ncbi:membrane protein [Bordetella trematum]|uniref:Membrane protein n=2 Tax=Bordetella trematum TaxID=123899 RepID=A0A157S8U2_9BORD|nr:DMT family transporter [Bordetella trematum]SAI50621.1 membrane protein [Bordetella trematum]SAI57954.1 membrane protein [Bordetella trematum]SAI66681.1 membrane protein [Bordetella trematum]SUV96487.1 membrane protein [Bordetella trematum]